MIIKIVYEDTIEINYDEIYKLFNHLKQRKDEILITSLSQNTKNTGTDVVICLYESVPIESIFQIKVNSKSKTFANLSHINDEQYSRKSLHEFNITTEKTNPNSLNLDQIIIKNTYKEEKLQNEKKDNQNINQDILDVQENGNKYENAEEAQIAIIKKLKEIIYTIFNYEKITIKNLNLKDEDGAKIKMNIPFYKYRSLHDSLNNVKEDRELYKIKEKTFSYVDNSLSAEEIIHCECDVLKELLRNTDLYFSDQLIVFRFYSFDENIYIQEVGKLENKQSLENIHNLNTSKYNYLKEGTSLITNGKLLKKSQNTFSINEYIQRTHVKNNIIEFFANLRIKEDHRVIRDAFVSDELNHKIEKRFYKIFEDKRNMQIIGEDNLLKIINSIPIFEDHRKNYLEKIKRFYEKNILFCREINNILFECDYLEIKKQRVVDSLPLGSLKREYN